MGNFDEYSSYEEVLGMLNISFPQGKREIKVDCPICGHHSFLINMQKNVGHCMHCNESKNYCSFFAACEGIDVKTAEKTIREHFNRPYESHYNAPKKFKEEKQSKKLPAEELNQFYQSLLDLCPLSKRHISDMQKRGVSIELLNKLKYGTYNYTDKYGEKRIELAKKSKAKLGIPGVFETRTGELILAYGKECILVPYRNRNNLITGLQMRINNELVKTKDDSKYIWFSSKDKKNGTSSGINIHYACDFYLNFTDQTYYPILGQKVRLTEGGMKADLIHYFSHEPILAIPGTKAIAALESEFSFLKSMGVTTIVDTFDMDYISNDAVAKDMEKLKAIIKSAGLIYEREDWDPEFKGYDDYLYHILKN